MEFSSFRGNRQTTGGVALLLIFSCLTIQVGAQSSSDQAKVEGSTNLAQQNDTVWVFTLIDGSQLVGRIANQNSTTMDIKQLNGDTRSIFIADIADQQPMEQLKIADGERWVSNPNRTRHLWSPSSMPLRKGESYLSQKEIIFTSYAIGITDNIAILVGSITPLLLAGGEGLNFIGAAKFAAELTSNFYLSGGGEMIWFPDLGSLALPYVGFSLGEPDLQFSLNAGKPFAFEEGSEAEELDAMISICGMWRFAGDHGLVSENIFLPGVSIDEGWRMVSLHGLAWRRIGQGTAFDLGFITLGGNPVLIPWFDFTWHFK